MIYVIISDIHSNLQAFEAAVSSFPSTRERIILCAGDTVGYGANPNECVDLMVSLGAINVLGNHDAGVLGKRDTVFFNQQAKAAVEWTRAVLSAEKADHLRGLGYTQELENITVAHGTLHSPEEFIYMMTGSDAMHSFELLKTGVCIVGHSHMPAVYMLHEGKIYESWKRNFKLENGSRYIINAGSVGQPRDGDRRACYCVYDTDSAEIEFRRIEYDIKSAHDAIIKAGLPASLAERLLIGR